MTTLAPRIAHNKRLAEDWIRQRGLRLGEPPVSEQVPTQPFNHTALFDFGYNPSIIRHGDGFLMVYRFHPIQSEMSRLAVAVMDSKFTITSNRVLDLPIGSDDPKLFAWEGGVGISWTHTMGSAGNWKCVVKYGRLENGQMKSICQPDFKNNNWSGLEKSWCFFEHETKLYAIYQPGVVIRVDGANAVKVFESSIPHWPWGRIKGGSQPIVFGDRQYMHFWHSTLDNEPAPWRRRYYIGALLMDAEPPFAVTKFCRMPIVRGSENDNKAQTGGCRHFKGNVVFPGSAVEHDGGYILPVGVNDSQCVLVKLGKDSLNL